MEHPICRRLLGGFLKEKAARLLFSQKFDGAGNPEGIGLSLWRVNLGGGSLEGDESPIKFPWRGARSFIDPESGKIDMSRCIGLRYFMEKAKGYGCENFLLFSNTPPIGMTKNSSYHKTEPDFRSNLKEDCYDDFAEYLAEVAKRLSDGGYNIKYISPVNEPSWKWTTDIQEGTPWLNPEIKRLAVELDKSIQKRGLETKIFLPEADSIQNIYGSERFQKDNPNSKEDAAFNQLYAFFDPASKDYIGGLKTLARQIGAHSYHTHLKNGQLREVRERAAAESQKYGVEYHQTEWCFLGFYADPKNSTDSLRTGRLKTTPTCRPPCTWRKSYTPTSYSAGRAVGVIGLRRSCATAYARSSTPRGLWRTPKRAARCARTSCCGRSAIILSS